MVDRPVAEAPSRPVEERRGEERAPRRRPAEEQPEGPQMMQVPQIIVEQFGREYGITAEMDPAAFKTAMGKIKEVQYGNIPLIKQLTVPAAQSYLVNLKTFGADDSRTKRALADLQADVKTALEELKGDKKAMEALAADPALKDLKIDVADSKAVAALIAGEMQVQARTAKGPVKFPPLKLKAHSDEVKVPDALVSKFKDAGLKKEMTGDEFTDAIKKIDQLKYLDAPGVQDDIGAAAETYRVMALNFGVDDKRTLRALENLKADTKAALTTLKKQNDTVNVGDADAVALLVATEMEMQADVERGKLALEAKQKKDAKKKVVEGGEEVDGPVSPSGGLPPAAVAQRRPRGGEGERMA
jgi:hypothetical protein